jgi:hypothetical protein
MKGERTCGSCQSGKRRHDILLIVMAQRPVVNEWEEVNSFEGYTIGFIVTSHFLK